MFYKPRTRWQRLTHHRAYRLLVEFVAGINAGNGLAHGMQPTARSAARKPSR
ncbi:MAG: hypothetical protein ABWY93_10320 [Mycobacterium sp.]